MAKKRTRAQKQQAQVAVKQRAVQPVVTSSMIASSQLPLSQTGTPVTQPQATFSAEKFFGYDPALIYQDLFKTVIVTLVVVGGLVSLYVFRQSIGL